MDKTFTTQPDAEGTAYLKWKTESNTIPNLLLLADSFLSSSIQLGQDCIRGDNKYIADTLIFAMLANANHGIELYLHACNWELNISLKKGEQFEGGLDIKKSYELILEKIEELDGVDALNEFKSNTESLKGYIDELYPLITTTTATQKAHFSRYPFSLNFEKFFYLYYPGEVGVDIEKFVENMRAMQKELEKLSTL